MFALTNGTMSIKNNLFYHVGNLFYFPLEDGLDPYSAPTELDYNMYITSRANQQICDLLVNGVRKQCTFAQVQAIPDAVGGRMKRMASIVRMARSTNRFFRLQRRTGRQQHGERFAPEGHFPEHSQGGELERFL